MMNTTLLRARQMVDRAVARVEQLQRQPRADGMHPARAHIHANMTLGERLADGMASAVGSWRFVIGQTIFIWAWILWNTLSGHSFDPFPWILLNLCMSTQAMYTGPVIMLSQNRQAKKDRMRDDTEAEEVDTLTTMNKQQLLILEQQNEILALLRDSTSGATKPAASSQAPGPPASQAQASQGSQPSQTPPTQRPRGPMLSRDRAIRKH